jgi:hypothetical protein
MCPQESDSGDSREDRASSAFSFGGGESPAYFGPDAPKRSGDARRATAGRGAPHGQGAGRHRAPLLAGLLALLVCAGAAIALLGGRAGGSSGASGGGAPIAGPAPVLARAAYVTSQAPGFQYSVSIAGTFAEHSFSVEGEGAIDERTLEGSASMTVEGQKLTEVIKNPYAYIRLPPVAGAAIADGKPWVRANLDAYTQALGAPSPFQGDTGRPAQTLSVLDSGGHVTKVGSEDVRGVASTHYRALLDVAHVDSAAAPAAARRYAEALDKLTGASSLPVDVWVDAQGRVRRFSLGLQAHTPVGAVDETVSMELFDFGPQPQVVVPAESEVTDITGAVASQASSALQQLGG